jgi:hypothetical protein
MKRRSKCARAIALEGVPVVMPTPAVRGPARVPGAVSRYEYLVTWQRDGWEPRSKRFASKKRAYDRVGIMTSDQPWRHWGSRFDRARSGDDQVCCMNQECSCGGATLAEDAATRREKFPPLLWIRVERRLVTRYAWEPVDDAEIPADLSRTGTVISPTVETDSVDDWPEISF